MSSPGTETMGRVQVPPGTTRRGLVSRARLQEQLRGDPDARVTVVESPAGYGKTTVLAEWAEADQRPVAWVTVERHHNDPAALVGQIAVALDASEPLGDEVFDALRAPHPSLETLLARLRDALHDREPFVLVLDDIHLLERAELGAALADLAEHVPAGSRIAFASRSESPLRVGRLRANRELVELGAADLVHDPVRGFRGPERARPGAFRRRGRPPCPPHRGLAGGHLPRRSGARRYGRRRRRDRRLHRRRPARRRLPARGVRREPRRRRPRVPRQDLRPGPTERTAL